MQDIRTITLDLDDTLWAIAPVIARAENALRSWFVEHYPRIPEAFSNEQAAELRARVYAQRPEKSHDLSFIRREVIRQMAVTAGYENIDVDAAFAVFDAVRNDIELFPDVRPALASLGRHYTLVAVTNGNANLSKIGIADLFDGLVNARKAGVAKPARRIFEMAVEAGGAAAAETVHVGDHPEMDVDGARLAGLRAIWINRHGHTWPPSLQEPDGIVADLHELDASLRARRA